MQFDQTVSRQRRKLAQKRRLQDVGVARMVFLGGVLLLAQCLVQGWVLGPPCLAHPSLAPPTPQLYQLSHSFSVSAWQQK
jgi:hypothetical protein